MRIELHLEIPNDLASAAEWYEGQRGGLGADFLQAAQAGFDHIGLYPDTGFPVEKRLRMLLVHGFPYGIVFRPVADYVLILAVHHLHRSQGYWFDRLRNS